MMGTDELITNQEPNKEKPKIYLPASLVIMVQLLLISHFPSSLVTVHSPRQCPYVAGTQDGRKLARLYPQNPLLISKPSCGRVLSHPVLEGKPNANHVRARISNSRTHQLHNMDIITQCSNSIKKGNNSRLHHMSETST
jgi:hypothetical protein